MTLLSPSTEKVQSEPDSKSEMAMAIGTRVVGSRLRRRSGSENGDGGGWGKERKKNCAMVVELSNVHALDQYSQRCAF